MKQLILAAAAAFGLAACTPKPKGPQLPPATQEGKNTIGAMINGKVYSTYDEKFDPIKCSRACKFYEGALGGHRISSNTCDASSGYSYLYIYIYANLEEGKTYILGSSNVDGNARVDESSYPYSYYETDYLQNAGSVTITKLSSTVIAGTFQFTAKKQDQSTITVTEGRFDLKRH